MSTAKFSTWLNPDGTENYKCRAWVNFNGTGTVAIRAAGNVSSITDNGAGDYTVNFTTAMPDANYAACLTTGNNNSTSTTRVYATTSVVAIGSLRFQTPVEGSTGLDLTNNNVAIFR